MGLVGFHTSDKQIGITAFVRNFGCGMCAQYSLTALVSSQEAAYSNLMGRSNSAI